MRSKRINACIEAAREHPCGVLARPAACCLFASVYTTLAAVSFCKPLPGREQTKRGFRTGFALHAVAATMLRSYPKLMLPDDGDAVAHARAAERAPPFYPLRAGRADAPVAARQEHE